MKQYANRIALVLFLFAITMPALADIPSPNKNTNKKPPKTNDVKMRMNITPDRNINEATLIIPRSLLKQLAADLNDDDSLNAAATNRFNLTPTQAIMFGLFLSLSVIFGGVWFVRSRSQKASRVVVVIAMIALCGAAATAVYANAGPPPVARSITSKILIQDAQYYGVWGEVKVQVSNDTNRIELKVPIPKESPSPGE